MKITGETTRSLAGVSRVLFDFSTSARIRARAMVNVGGETRGCGVHRVLKESRPRIFLPTTAI